MYANMLFPIVCGIKKQLNSEHRKKLGRQKQHLAVFPQDFLDFCSDSACASAKYVSA